MYEARSVRVATPRNAELDLKLGLTSGFRACLDLLTYLATTCIAFFHGLVICECQAQ